jgi:hypothetical protein
MISRTDRVIAGIIVVLVTVITLAFSTQQGITRDEAYYMKAGELYIQYYDDALSGRLTNPLAARSIDAYWSYNTEHPALFKLLYGASWRVLHQCTCAADNVWHPSLARIVSGTHGTLGLMSEVTAFRLPTAVSFGALCALVYLFFIEALGSRLGAVAAALLMLAQPRAFFHAQTASFDLPVATLWFATTYAYWRALGSKSWRAAGLTGVLFGLFLSTKLQSFFLPLTLTAHWLWLAWQRRRAGQTSPDAKSLWLMAVVGPMVMFALWPWLWHEPLSHLRDYLAFHWHHVHYNFEYLGRNYNQPPYPWHEPLGMLVLTAPVMLLVLAATGIVLLAWPSMPNARDDRATRALLLLAGAAPFALFLRGVLPIYGETKHWLATMPFLAVSAGYAVDRLGAALDRELHVDPKGPGRAARALVLLTVVFAPAAVETVHSHPYGLSHYNALAGGAPGGADLGMNRQYWGYSVKGLLPWLNDNLPPRAAVFLHDWNHDAYNMYMRARELRPDVIDAGHIGDRGTRFISDAALVIHEKHFNEFDYLIWEAYGHVQPAEVLAVDGVPLVSVYLRSGPVWSTHPTDRR